MEHEKQEQFRKEFRSIVYQNSLMADSGKYLTSLHKWDKNDSHKKSILAALDARKELQNKLKEMLKGSTYEDWKLFSKRLSVLNSRLKNAITQKEKAESEINKLEFNL